MDRPRPTCGRHRPGPGDGRRAEGRQRPPRHRHEPGARDLPAVATVPAPRPQRPRLGRPRPVRALPRPLEPHALHPALPVRLRPDARRPQGLPHLGQPHARAPRARPHPGRRDDHRPARPGPRQRRRHGDGRALRASLLDPDAAPGASVFDHTIWCFASDGDLQEGITSEASSLAGHPGASATSSWSGTTTTSPSRATPSWPSPRTPSPATRRTAGTSVRRPLRRTATSTSRAWPPRSTPPATRPSRPSFIGLRTTIGWPAPTLQNTGKAHGSALGADEVAATKVILGFDPEQDLRRSSPRSWRTPARSVTAVGELRGHLGEALPGLAYGAAGARRPPRPAARAPAPRRLGGRAARLRGLREGPGHPRLVRRGPLRPRPGAPRAVRRLGRPGRLEQHHHQGLDVVPAAASRTAARSTSASASTRWARR